MDFRQLWPVWNLWWLSSSADCIDNISVHAAVRQTQVPRMENTKNAQGQCDTKLGYETIHEMVVLIVLASNEGSGESVHLHHHCLLAQSMDVYKVSDQDKDLYCRANQDRQ